MQLERADLCRLIPHADAMCLLDGVLEWTSDYIRCISDSHQNSQNPLRHYGRLSALCAFEYGAQAAAVHGGLCTNQHPAPAYLAALRDGRCHVRYLDNIAETLQVEAWLQYRTTGNQIYQSRISAGDLTVAKVRITVMAIQQRHAALAKNLAND